MSTNPTNWMTGLQKLCARFNVEASIMERSETQAIQKMQFNCPRELATEEKGLFTGIIPAGVTTDFIVHPKNSTIGLIQNLLLQMGIAIDHDEAGMDYLPDDRRLELKVHLIEINISSTEFETMGIGGQGFPPAEHTIWDKVSMMIKSDGAFDTWKISCELQDFSVERNLADIPEASDVGQAEEEGDSEADILAKESLAANEPEATPPPAYVKRVEPVQSAQLSPAPAKPSVKPIKVKLEEPKRERKIGEEDVMDLTIALETQSIDEIFGLNDGKKEEQK